MVKNFFSKIGRTLSFVWKNNKVWFIVTTAGLVFIITISLIITQVTLINNTFNTLFGEERRVLVSGDPSTAQYYTPSNGIMNKADALKNANAVNEKIAKEGFTLLKNDDALPLSADAKISVFGMNSVDLVYGGSGSGAKDTDNVIDIYKSLDNAGITYNTKLKTFYESQKSAGKGRGKSPSMGTIPTGFATGELPLSSYNGGSIIGYVDGNTDAALLVFSRIGGEGYDLPRQSINTLGRSDAAAHYLELDDNEKALTAAVCAAESGFKNVIIIVNSSAPIELGFVDDPAYNGKLKGVLWVGSPGGTGMNALGKILKGEVNPSGRTVDTYAKNFIKDPTYQNFSNNFADDGNVYHIDGVNQKARFIDYEEGIYVGYRYYETRGFTDGDIWYEQNVMYPFGYGLSYSEFDWTLGNISLVEEDDTGSSLPAILSDDDKDKSITINITVKNEALSSHSGKDVVQLYVKTPYTGKIEKAHVVLADFEKTDTLEPGKAQEVTLTVKLSDIASYDYKETQAYVLEAGSYTLYVGKNAHDAWTDRSISASFTINEKIVYAQDTATGTTIQNRFDDVTAHIEDNTGYLSRNNWDGTFPAAPDYDDRNVTEELIFSMTEEAYIGKSGSIDKGKKWQKDGMPRQQSRPMSYNDTMVKLYDLIDADYDDSRWETLLSQLTIRQMASLIGTGNFNTAKIESIDKPATIDPDGPAGFTNFMSVIDAVAVVYDTCFYASECVIGATWNKQLAREMGEAVGNEGLIGNERGDGRPYSGWYAPACNIHRSPFSGRNWEYYSEDSYLSGKMAANAVAGAKSKGVYTYVKHFALNDQETDRDTYGLITWANEQSMRELYLKPFEMTVKEGQTSAMMSSFNRIGTVWAGGSYELLTEILRDEWGFTGMVISDYNTNDYMTANQMIRAGGDLNLIQDKAPSVSGPAFTTSHVSAIRTATKNILFTIANSNAMNGMGPGIIYRYAMPYWKILLIAIDCAIGVGLAIWGFFAIRMSTIRQKERIVKKISE